MVALVRGVSELNKQKYGEVSAQSPHAKTNRAQVKAFMCLGELDPKAATATFHSVYR